MPSPSRPRPTGATIMRPPALPSARSYASSDEPRTRRRQSERRSPCTRERRTSSQRRGYMPCWPDSCPREPLFHQEVHMSPNFFDQLNLQNSSRTVAAGGPCNWQNGDESAEIRDVRVEQGSVVG